MLARQFSPAAPNPVYASDITYILTGAGRLYLAIVLDLFQRKNLSSFQKLLDHYNVTASTSSSIAPQCILCVQPGGGDRSASA